MAAMTGFFGIALFLAACASGITEPGDDAIALEVSPSPITLEVGDSLQLVAIATNAAHESVDGETGWTSRDPSIASVSATGFVVAMAAGTTSVDAEFRGKGKALGRLKKSTLVTVEDPPGNDDPLPDENQQPTAGFSARSTDLTVTFTDESSDADGVVASWSWDFGDGNGSTTQSPTHVYSSEGTYAVTLTVTDDDGASGDVSHSVTATAPRPPADDPGPQEEEIPFGPSRMDITIDYPFNASLYYRVHAGEEEAELSMLRESGYRGSLYIAGGRERYKNPDGSFNPELWKAEVDKFDVAAIQKYVDNGTLVAHYALDEPHAEEVWDGRDVPPALVDEIACYSKQKWPNLPVLIRTHPGWAVREEGAAHKFECVDIWVAQYSARKGPIQEYVSQNLADAAQLGAELYGALNPLTGGDGSSGIESPYGGGRWMMSDAELREYGAAWIAAPISGFSIWAWGWRTTGDVSWYWTRPEIRAAVQYLADLL